MDYLWFYGRGTDITGPVSGPELTRLATDGTLLRTDTVWRDGTEQGVNAGAVKNLFPVETPIEPSPLPKKEEPWSPPVSPYPVPEKKKGRAVAGKGAVLIGQDGSTVKFRMKCPDCKHEDSSWKTTAIPRGSYRTSFYCPKCRKKRDAEILGYW